MEKTFPAVKVDAVEYVTFQTQDPARLANYYTNALGFMALDSSDDSRVYLSENGANLSVVLEKADNAQARARIGYRIKGDTDEAIAGLQRSGHAFDVASDVSPGERRVIVLQEPETGVPIHLVAADGGPADAVEANHIAPTKLGHVAAYTSNLETMQTFYQDLLGFQWSDTIGDFFVFLRCNTDHHAANFMKSNKYSGMHHVAYEMRDLNHLQEMLDHLASQEIRLDWGPGRHGPGHNIFTYHNDPDGNVIELFTQLDVMDDAQGAYEPRPWHEDFPQVPKTWEADLAAQNSWGPGNPAMRDR